MNATPQISGIHHITAVSSDAVQNLAFYTQVLGLRLVKQTVNYDDPYTYHLYYGDNQGSPGTILTFFPWQSLPKGRPGAGMITAIAFAVPGDTMNFWVERLSAAGIQMTTEERFGEPVIRLHDPHGLPLELIGVAKSPSILHWDQGPVPRESAITGFHSATATLNTLDHEQALIAGVMDMALVHQEQGRYRFKMEDASSPGHLFDLKIDADAGAGRSGSGVVHHIAFRTYDDRTQAQWQTILRRSGFNVTGVRDRKYFRSIYFHSPGGMLFEMATDPPGFGVDESQDRLGSALQLPSQYEDRRAEITRYLPPLCEDPSQCNAPDQALV